ncbi:MAG: phosphoenolpyruvate synthase [Chloroflexi bacterium]|nr:phosphoenolpyruvate synthase [Chloroflexota bacterium]
MAKTIVWFKEVGKNDIGVAGGKGANLGEMTRAGIPVPPGFIVTSQTYFEFIQQANLTEKLGSLLRVVDPDDSKTLNNISIEIKKMILTAEMPSDIAVSIKAAYKEMGQGRVAVRSSATAEDLPEASFAGQQSTYLNIEGPDEVVSAVKRCWASLFEARAIYYREQHNFDHFSVGIAVPVQKMVQSEASGVAFTVEPITSNVDQIVIEAIYGLGEGLVSGEVKPDLFIINKEDGNVISRNIALQDTMLIRNPDITAQEMNIWAPVINSMREKQKISDTELQKLIKTVKGIEKHYGQPQDIEWAKEGSEIYILQTRPVTTIVEGGVEKEEEIDAPILLDGDAASPGLATGPVKIIHDPTQIDKVFEGDILVAEMTTPDFVPAMKRAAAIVTDKGGRTSHASIVSRELGIPCIVGTTEATKILKNGQIITVDGANGKAYNGKVTRNVQSNAMADMVRANLVTKTKVYVNLAQPDLAERVAAKNVDGIGLMRAEFIVSAIGKHPKYMIKNGLQEEFISKLTEGLMSFAKAFYPRPVVYRTTDFKTNEYRDLLGGKEFEEYEENPMIGYRGASRYIADPDSFDMEIAAIKRCREKYDNLHVMIPFVRTVVEMKNVKTILEKKGLSRSENFKLWMMAEIPANVILIDEFIDVGIDGISIGSNDLTQLTLGIDRDSSRLADLFDERNPAVLKSLEKLITVCKERGITCGICGQAPSFYPDLTEKLVKWGVTSVSVSPDMIGTTREIIAKAEAKLREVTK